MGQYTPSEEERTKGLDHIARIKRQLSAKNAATALAMPPTVCERCKEPVHHVHAHKNTGFASGWSCTPDTDAEHAANCGYCQRLACFACSQDGRPMADCRHELPARHGAGDLTNPDPPEPPDSPVAADTDTEETPMPEEPTDA